MTSHQTEIKFNTTEKSVEALMFVFKTQGVVENNYNLFSIDLFRISVNNASYIVRANRQGAGIGTNFLTLTELGGLTSTDGREAEIYVNGKLSPINYAEISLNEWVSLVIKFKNSAAASQSLSSFEVLGTTTTNISQFSVYSLDLAKKGEAMTYNTWDDIDNINWYNYTQGSQTWQKVHGTSVNVYEKTSAEIIWNTLISNSQIKQTNNQLTLDEVIPLQIGNYQYETYIDFIKESIYRSPA